MAQVEPSSRRIGVSQWVVTRALCRFNRFDLSRLPAAKRKAALALQLPQWSPYPDSNYAISWQNGCASVWCWDKDRVDSEMLRHGKKPKSQKIIPETMLRVPQHQGMRLLKCLDGVEGQYWQDGELLISRWWPQKPDEHAWLAFQRDSGVPAEQHETNIVLQDLPLLDRPWGKIVTPGSSRDDLQIAEVVLYTGLLLCLGLVTLYQGIEHFQIDRAIAKRADEVAVIKSKAGSVFTARETALGSLARLKSINAIEPYPQPLILMAAIAETLPKDSGAYVREWDMTGNHLKIAITSSEANIAGATYVQALEKSGLFADIQIITDADSKSTSFSMTILPIDAVAAAGARIK